MIPAKIHYCWFGGKEMGKKERKCLESWRRFCPDYEIIRWDESNSPLQENLYVRQAYEAGKWAFVSDFVRMKAIFSQGGIYLDTDVELRKPLDSFLNCQGVMGFEDSSRVATCLMAAEAGHPFWGEALQKYQELSFQKEDGTFDYTTNVIRMSGWLREHGLRGDGSAQVVAGISVYPQDYFSPKDLETGRIILTKNTHAVHHFHASWMPLKNRLHTRLAQLLGPKKTIQIKRLLGRE